MQTLKASSTNPLSLTIINRYYPPNPSINGESACDLAHYILNNYDNVIINIVHSNASYDGGGSTKTPVGQLHEIKSLYNGRNKLLRLLGNFIEGYFLVRKAAKIKSDVIICLTNPPLINFWASALLNRKKNPWCYWALDLYPDAFISARIIGKRNVLYSLIKKVLRSNPPNILIALGLNQAGFIQKDYDEKIETIILPCGIQNIDSNKTSPAWKAKDEKIYFGYIGNIGEAHSAEFLINFIKNLNPNKHKIILSLYGAKASQILEAVKHLPSVEIVSKVKREDLFYIDIHLVSLLAEWTHVCVPSKAISAVCAKRPINFNGSASSDTWNILCEAGWIIEDSKNQEAIKTLLNSITIEDIIEKGIHAEEISKKLLNMEKHGYDHIIQAIFNIQRTNIYNCNINLL